MSDPVATTVRATLGARAMAKAEMKKTMAIIRSLVASIRLWLVVRPFCSSRPACPAMSGDPRPEPERGQHVDPEKGAEGEGKHEHAGGEAAMAKDAQIDDGVLLGQFPDQEGEEEPLDFIASFA